MDIWLADVEKGEIGYVTVSYGGISLNGSITSNSYVFQSPDAISWSIIDTVPTVLCSIDFIEDGKTLMAGGGYYGNRNGGIVYRSSGITPVKSRATPHSKRVTKTGITGVPYILNGKTLPNSNSSSVSGISVHNRRAAVGISHNRRSQ